MAISLSKDGLSFDRVALIRRDVPKMRYKGRWKAEGFQYPYSLVLGNNVWVIYSVGKEDFQLTRISIIDIQQIS